MKRIVVGNVEIGDGLPPLLIAEIGLNHNGSVQLAREMIDAAVQSGAHVVKFQKRTPDALATAAFLDAPFQKCPLFGRTQREVRNRLEFTESQLSDLKAYAAEKNVMFSMSVFDVPSLEIALGLDLDFIKVASHSVTNQPLLKAVAKTNKPVFFSMGASTWAERDAAFNCLKENPLVVLHCVSAYPCPDRLLKLNTIEKIRQRYDCVVGYSGHEVGILPSIIAASMGASVIERHFTLNRSMVGLDHKLSLLPHEFAEMADNISRVPNLMGEVDGIMSEELPSRTSYHVAVCTTRKLPKGHVMTADDVCCKQPLGEPLKYYTGQQMHEVLGKTILQPIDSDQPLPVSCVK